MCRHASMLHACPSQKDGKKSRRPHHDDYDDDFGMNYFNDLQNEDHLQTRLVFVRPQHESVLLFLSS